MFGDQQPNPVSIILYQMLSGDLPFTAQETSNYMLAHINEPVPDIAARLPDSPAGLEVSPEKGVSPETSTFRGTAHFRWWELGGLLIAAAGLTTR